MSGGGLEREARALYAAFFPGQPAPESIVEQYARACRTLWPSGGYDLEPLLDRGVDIEAVEYALRGRAPLLSAKVQALFYLVEADGGRFELFVDEKGSRPEAWLRMAGAVLRSAFKLAKGRWQAWRHGLA